MPQDDSTASPSRQIRFNSTAVERFWAKVDKNGPVPEHRPELGNCWVWMGQINNKGYGLFKPMSYARMEYCHRIAWIFAYGEIPNGLHILHRCDNPACLRFDHLRAGTRVDNARDMAAKLRGNTTKLSTDDIKYIRKIYSYGRWGDVIDLARQFNMDRASIRRVAKSISFKDINSDSDQDSVFISGSDATRPLAMDGSQIICEPMRERMNLVGHTYSRLTVKAFLEAVGHSDANWLCICICGRETVARTSNLRRGKPISCGCLNDENRRKKQPPLEIRFWELVDKRGPDECWPWKGSLFNGYGSIKRKGVKMGAHRASWEIAHPDEPRLGPDDFVCHKCNFPTCVNPSHLLRGNITINNFDRDIKAANKDWTFNRTANLITEIKGLRANGLRYEEISEVTGVRIVYIRAILSGKYEV